MSASRLSSAREAQLIDIALDLVREVGFERFTMDAVAARAATSKSTLYRRWSGKTELVAAAIGPHVRNAFRVGDNGSFRADALAALHSLADWIRTDGTLLLSLAEASSRDQLLASVFDSVVARPHDDMWSDVINRARIRGELREGIDQEWLNELCQGVVFNRVLIVGDSVSDGFLNRLVDEVILPLFLVIRE